MDRKEKKKKERRRCEDLGMKEREKGRKKGSAVRFFEGERERERGGERGVFLLNV